MSATVKPNHEYQEGELLRLEDLCLIKNDQMGVADHANGILVFKLGPDGTRLVKHLNGAKDTLAFSVRYNERNEHLYALILDVPGWILNVYDVNSDFTLVKQIPSPSEPEVGRMKLRWLTVTAQGTVYVMAAGNVWELNEDTWRLVHGDQCEQAWYSHLTPIGQSEPGHFLICCRGSKLRKAEMNENDGTLIIKKGTIETPEIKEMGAFTADEKGNILISDWNTGQVLLRNDKNETRILGNVGEAEAYVMAAASGMVYVGCKSSLQVRVFKY